ncbi:MAG: hypothetical protein ABW220_16220, partial [Burkholderiaceae bacterium]
MTVDMKRVVAVLFSLVAFTASAQSIKADPAAKRAIVEKAMTIRAGDTVDAVIAKLGKPAVDRTTSMGSYKTITRSLKYHLRKGGAGGGALDEYIDVYLDKNNR